MSRLLLIDIDGTLLTTNRAGLRAYKTAADAVLGSPIKIKKHHFAGKLDKVIFKGFHDEFNVSSLKFEEAWPLFRESYLEGLRKEAENTEGWLVYPGVREFLAREEKQSRMALITGNIREGAHVKLSAVGLWDYFRCGAYGDEGETREALAGRALANACACFGQTFSEVWVIGDTVADIACGKAIGAKTLGVRTGFSKKGELEAVGADVVVETLADVVFNAHDPLDRGSG
ncbi:MAG: HAD family hydrolase [Fibrobacterota bacterium]